MERKILILFDKHCVVSLKFQNFETTASCLNIKKKKIYSIAWRYVTDNWKNQIEHIEKMLEYMNQ